MYRKILIATDGSAISRKAVKHGIALAKQLGAKVVGFFSPEDYRLMFYPEVVTPLVAAEQEFEELSKKAATKRLSSVEKAANAPAWDMRVGTPRALCPGRPSSMWRGKRSAI